MQRRRLVSISGSACCDAIQQFFYPSLDGAPFCNLQNMEIVCLCYRDSGSLVDICNEIVVRSKAAWIANCSCNIKYVNMLFDNQLLLFDATPHDSQSSSLAVQSILHYSPCCCFTFLESCPCLQHLLDHPRLRRLLVVMVTRQNGHCIVELARAPA